MINPLDPIDHGILWGSAVMLDQDESAKRVARLATVANNKLRKHGTLAQVNRLRFVLYIAM